MAIKYFCDICDKEMAKNNLRIELVDLELSQAFRGVLITKEICDDCFNKFKKEIFKVIM